MTDIDLARVLAPTPRARATFLRGALTLEVHERHECFSGPAKIHVIALVSLHPRVWMLQSPSGITSDDSTHALTIVSLCPWCGRPLDPPPPALKVCTCTHADTQHAYQDPLLRTFSGCTECACAKFSERT